MTGGATGRGIGPGGGRTGCVGGVGGGRGRAVRALLRATLAAALSGAPLLAAACGADASAGGGDPDGSRSGATGGEGREATASGRAGAGRVVNVETSTLRERPFTEVIRLTGTAAASRDVEVAAQESGVIREIVVEKGTPVDADRVIARIDDAILRAQVEEARARARLAEETWQRRRRLYEEERAISELSYLEARARADEAAARLEALEERLARTRVRAPFEGVLDDQYVELGSTVSPGSRVARVVQLDPILVRAGVPERYAADVDRGDEVSVRFPVLPDTTFRGRLTFVGSVVDRDSRTFPVELTVRNRGRVVKPEMVADLEIVRRRWERAIVIPREALVRKREGFVAFVVEERAGEGPVARERAVALGPSRADSVVVTDGLAPGDRLVVAGQQMVAEGDRVRIVGGGAAGKAGRADGAGPDRERPAGGGPEP